MSNPHKRPSQKVTAGTPISRQHNVTVTLAHHVPLDSDGLPAGLTHHPKVDDALPGETRSFPYQMAQELIVGGYVLVDPADRAAVAKILQPPAS